MASSYSTLKLELIAVGETGSAGNWGTTTNNNLGGTTSTTRGIEQAIGGFSAVTLTTTSTTLAYTNTTANQDFRSLFLSFSGSPGAASTVIIPSTSVQKLYIIKNSISGGYSLTVKYASSTGTVVPNGSTAILYANGTDVIPGQDYIPALTLGSALPVTSGGTGVTTSTGTGSVVLSAAPTLTSPSLSAETFSTSASVTAGTNAQGQGALTSDYNVITTAAANPSGVTLPAATTGRRVVVVNKGANPINVYPATSAYIDGNAINTSIQIIANGVMIFNASSATQWYSSYNLMTPSSTGAVNSFSAGSTGLTPNTASTGNIVLAGTLATSNGGTGLSGATPFTANGAVYASSTSALTTGTLPVASGGTGITSFGTGVATALGQNVTGSNSIVLSTSPSLTTPSLSGETFSTAATVTAGTNAQGQGALTNDYNVITTAASNPSGVTLPTATTGRRIVVVNKGANAVNVYPASSGFIDALAINTSIQIAVNGVMEFNASSTTQWYSSYNLYTSATAAAGVTSFSAGTTGFSPSSATTGAITLSGTLNVLNGGTGVTTSTGSGNNVLSNSPTLVTPVLGTPSSGTLTNCTNLPVSTGISGLGTGVATFLGTPSSANLAAAVTDETGSGSLVFATSPTLVTPALGTPSSGTLTNCTSLPISTGVSGLGTGVATFLATPSSANLAAAVTDETGSGALVFATSPALVTPALGTPSSGTLTSCTGLPLSTGVTGQLSVSNGGTGTSSLTANNVLLGNGTSAVQVVAPSTAGNVLISDGTTWSSSAMAPGFSDMVVLSTVGTSTWQVPAGITRIKVTVLGGGGGGRGSTSGSPTAGGTSSFGPVSSVTITCTGGGPGASGSGGAGGTASATGSPSNILLLTGTAGTSYGLGGAPSILGGGAASGANNATAYGSGGGGGGSGGSGSGGAGGAAIWYVSGLTPLSNISFTVGAAGTATAGSGGGNGFSGVVIVEY